MDQLTLAAVLTAAGATASAALITGLIAMFKNLPRIGPWLDNGNEPLVAFVLSAVLVIAAFASVGTVTAASVFGAFLAWYGVASIAMQVHDQAAALRRPPAASFGSFDDTEGGTD